MQFSEKRGPPGCIWQQCQVGWWSFSQFMSSERTKVTARPRTCYDQIQMPSDRSHSRHQEDVYSNQIETRSEKSQISVERFSSRPNARCLLYDQSNIWWHALTLSIHSHSAQARPRKPERLSNCCYRSKREHVCGLYIHWRSRRRPCSSTRVDLCSFLLKGEFPLTKRASNSQKVMEATPLQERAPRLIPTTSPEKWDVMEYTRWCFDVHKRFQYPNRGISQDKAKSD